MTTSGMRLRVPVRASAASEEVGFELESAREATLALVEPFDDQTLERQLDLIMSPLAWDLGHIAAYEDLWLVHRHGGRALLRPELAALYDAFELPRAVRGEVELLGPREALAYMRAVRERALGVLAERGASDLHEMVLRHELQHCETMRQTLFLAGLAGGARTSSPQLPPEPEWVALPAGAFAMGAGADGFAFDNERPRHQALTGSFRIASTPVANSSFLMFVGSGGYEHRPWWSERGWAWKERYGVRHPLGWQDGPPGHPAAPVEHVSWFEAEAFARSVGARLPTEAEWEKAATWDGGVLQGTGEVWEWTATQFDGYPGFEAYPYREYSEVFFGRGYRVLRGGSWASSPRVATTRFRNWDLPERRQIFAGLRLAEDCA